MNESRKVERTKSDADSLSRIATVRMRSHTPTESTVNGNLFEEKPVRNKSDDSTLSGLVTHRRKDPLITPLDTILKELINSLESAPPDVPVRKAKSTHQTQSYQRSVTAPFDFPPSSSESCTNVSRKTAFDLPGQSRSKRTTQTSDYLSDAERIRDSVYSTRSSRSGIDSIHIDPLRFSRTSDSLYSGRSSNCDSLFPSEGTSARSSRVSSDNDTLLSENYMQMGSLRFVAENSESRPDRGGSFMYDARPAHSGPRTPEDVPQCNRSTKTYDSKQSGSTYDTRQSSSTYDMKHSVSIYDTKRSLPAEKVSESSGYQSGGSSVHPDTRGPSFGTKTVKSRADVAVGDQARSSSRMSGRYQPGSSQTPVVPQSGHQSSTSTSFKPNRPLETQMENKQTEKSRLAESKNNTLQSRIQSANYNSNGDLTIRVGNEVLQIDKEAITQATRSLEAAVYLAKLFSIDLMDLTRLDANSSEGFGNSSKVSEVNHPVTTPSEYMLKDKLAKTTDENYVITRSRVQSIGANRQNCDSREPSSKPPKFGTLTAAQYRNSQSGKESREGSYDNLSDDFGFKNPPSVKSVEGSRYRSKPSADQSSTAATSPKETIRQFASRSLNEIVTLLSQALRSHRKSEERQSFSDSEQRSERPTKGVRKYLSLQSKTKRRRTTSLSSEEKDNSFPTPRVDPLSTFSDGEQELSKRVIYDAKQFPIPELTKALRDIDEKHPVGNVRYRHHHWRISPAECDAVFLCKVSDDDRMSLTTAVSDEEEGGGSADGQSASPHKSKKVAAAAFNCTGAVRKAGFLSVKKWLIRKRHQIELAHKRGWRGYWVCLKGTTLLFYPCDARDGRGVEAAPRHLIIVDGAILQPIPEHPKRDFVFCLSTAFGDAYLFQAPCQAELENWVNSIHSACAAAFARHRGKTGTLHLLQEEIYRIERSIESDSKLRHMAELQLSVVSDSDSRRQIAAQIAGWDDTLERLHCEQFRLRCYMASLQRGELPNPKGLLAHVSRSTKSYLNRLGVFTVSSLHAYICARSPSLLNNLLAGRGATRRRSVAPSLSRSNSLGSRRSQSQSQDSGGTERIFTVNLPDGQSVNVAIRDGMTVEEFLSAACNRRGVNPAEHFVRVKKRRHMDASNHFVPHRGDAIDSYVPSHEVVEICAKTLYQVELTRTSLEHRWGFSVEAELVENADRQDELGCVVSRVEETGLASEAGLQKSDEIMVLNGALVADLDMMYIESVLQEELSLCLMLRSCRADPPAPAINLSLDLNLIDSLVCPPPPSDPLISDDIISGLIVPAPSAVTAAENVYGGTSNRERGEGGNEREKSNQRQQEAIEKNNLIKASQRMSPTGCVTPSHSRPVTPGRSMSEADRLRKVLKELVGTERTYVQHLNCLLENYLEPLQKQTLLSTAEINALFGNIREIVAFQRLFLAGLESALDAEPNLEDLERADQFQDVLCGVAGTFLRYVYHFRLYSSFCASHSKAQKILHPVEGSPALQAFLAARNPGHQHSSTLESHLIRPIQRVLHYPLLLTQLKTLTIPGTDEYKKIDEALRGMERVAEHINEMQRIHEEYGAIFEHLARQHQRTTKQTVDLSPGALLHYGGVEWLNLTEFLGKVKRGLELHAMTFVFSSAVVFLCKERLRQKRKIMSVSPRPNGEVEVIRYQVLIPVSEVQVRSAATKSPENNYRWELVHLRNQFQKRAEKVYNLSNSTAEFRNAFLKTIRQIIRESVRNMSIPSTKLSSSKSQDYDNIDPKEGRLRSQTLTEPREEIIHRSSDGTEPDTEDDTKSSTSTTATQRRRSLLGRTPNHLSLSTTSTISTGSGGSQSAARLVHASNTPAQYKPQVPKPLGSPVWKPRDEIANSFTLPRASSSGLANRQSSVQAETRRVPYATLGRSGSEVRANSVRHLDC